MDDLRRYGELARPGDGPAVQGARDAPLSVVDTRGGSVAGRRLSRRELLALGAGLVGLSGDGGPTSRRVASAIERMTTRQASPLLKAAINGARPAGSHPALPVTPEECARAAASSVAAGAGAVHVHVRGPDGAQSLEGGDVAATLRQIRAAAPGTPVGVSTLLGIVGDAALRHELVDGWSILPDFASVNFNEEGSVRLAELLLGRGVGVEAGLFDADAARACVGSGLASRCLRLMLEPRAAPLSAVLRSVDEMEAVLDAAGVGPPRLLHGSRDIAWALIEEAARRGHQTRAGLEDTFELPDGSTASGNAEIVAEAVRRIAAVREAL